MIVQTRAHARAGLLGNPSDMFWGKVMAVPVQNWQATAEIWESPELQLLPNSVHDPMVFRDGLEQLDLVVGTQGHYGGLRLMLSACQCFHGWCRDHRFYLPDRKFTLRYDTNIPRQVGLGGSSAIVTAVIKALLKFYDISRELYDLADLPSLVLAVETSLGISAGLMDRVTQVYDGLVYMDFERQYVSEHGHGRYERMDSGLLMPMFVARDPNYRKPEDSGGVHVSIRERWKRGDEDVHAAMAELAVIAEDGVKALRRADWEKFGQAMTANFAVRRKLYCLPESNSNVRMIEIARAQGSHANQCGSGGAIIGLKPDGPAKWHALQRNCRETGFEVVEAVLPPANELRLEG